MSQSRHIIEQLLVQDKLAIAQVDAAARELEVYPSKRTWLDFFDKALLIVGAVTVVLSLVFFIAYNWLHMGKLAKFALVEGALVITIALYVALSFRQRFAFIRQLLLLIASIITGSLLALFGQVYQTGADTWQLFFGWALLISPWVLIARFPALWLLWLGLVNGLVLLYIDTSLFFGIAYYDQEFWQFTLFTILNFSAFYLWLLCFENKRSSGLSDLNVSSLAASNTHSLETISAPNTVSKSSLHWSTYVVGLLSTYTVTHLVINSIFDHRNIWLFLLVVSLWLGWCGFMFWRFYRRHIDLLMLTYLSFSIITVVMFWVGKWLLDGFDAGGFLILALLLIGMSSSAVVWLRKVSRLKDENNVPSVAVKGSDHEY